MLKQLITTISSLCCYFMLIIGFNFIGMSEEMNLFLSSILVSMMFMLVQIQRIFYWVSIFFLISLTVILAVFHLSFWILLGIVMGCCLVPHIKSIQLKLKDIDLNKLKRMSKSF